RAPAGGTGREPGRPPPGRPPARVLELCGGRGLGAPARPGRLPRRRRVRAWVGGPRAAPTRARGLRSGGGDPDVRAGRVAERLDGGGRVSVRGGAAARWRLSSTSSTATTSAICADRATTTRAPA